MTRWRTRLGQTGAESLLTATIQAGLKLQAIKPSDLSRVNVDTTVQTKAIRYPTDARLYDRARERLVEAARKEELRIKQSYCRVGNTPDDEAKPLLARTPDKKGSGGPKKAQNQSGQGDS